MGEVRQVGKEEWNKLVSLSPQGTVFSTTDWMDLTGDYTLWGYYKNGNLAGGIGGFSAPQPLTPFQGVLTAPSPDMKYASVTSLHNEVAYALLDVVPACFSNHYTYPDIRPFLWDGAGANVKYTYVVDLTDMPQLWAGLEKSTRYDVTKAQRLPLTLSRGYDSSFYDLYTETFSRKGLGVPASADTIKKVAGLGASYLVSDNELLAGAAVIFDNKRAYYILAASRVTGVPSLLLWEIFKDLAGMGYKEIDLVGANTQNIALFKRGFGGKLTPYYEVSYL